MVPVFSRLLTPTGPNRGGFEGTTREYSNESQTRLVYRSYFRPSCGIQTSPKTILRSFGCDDQTIDLIEPEVERIRGRTNRERARLSKKDLKQVLKILEALSWDLHWRLANAPDDARNVIESVAQQGFPNSSLAAQTQNMQNLAAQLGHTLQQVRKGNIDASQQKKLPAKVDRECSEMLISRVYPILESAGVDVSTSSTGTTCPLIEILSALGIEVQLRLEPDTWRRHIRSWKRSIS